MVLPSDPAEATPIAQVVLDLAHFANGAGIISAVVLVNVAPHPIQPALYFYDQEGEPIAAESMVDVLGDLGIQEDGGLTIRTEMEPLGELTISTHGRGDLVSGSVKVAAYGAIGGVLRFDLPGIGVAGVQVSQPLRDAIFPVRRREGGIDTGMALHNREEEAAVVSCRLMKNGAVLEEVEITLAANGQVARFIGEVFTGTDTSDFVGLVRCTAEGVAQFTGMALELDAGNRIFTTLPVVKVNRGRAGEAALDFAHFANGASVVSEMVFMNLETQPSGPPPTPFHQAIPPTRPVLYFYDQEGNPIDPALLVDLTGDLEITEDGALSIQSEMEPLGELTISTHGRGELVSGSVRVVSDGPIGGVLRFDLPGIGVAGVGASQPVRDAIFPARRQAGGISTAAAIHNLGEEALVVSCQLMKDGCRARRRGDLSGGQRTGGPVHRGDVYQYRYIRFRGVGALYGTARGGDVHRGGRGTRCGQPHLYDTAGGTGGGNAESGGAMKSSVLMHLTLKRRAHQHQNRGMVNDIRVVAQFRSGHGPIPVLFECYRIRTDSGMPRLDIRFSTSHLMMASTR